MGSCDKCGKEIEVMCAECRPVQLTERQQRILEFIADGFTSKEIEQEMFVSTSTIKRELRNMFNKFGYSDRASIVACGFRQGLLK